MRPARASVTLLLLALLGSNSASAQGGVAPLSVALRAGTAGDGDGRRAVFAWVELSVPFDRVAQGRSVRVLADGPGAPVAEGSGRDPEETSAPSPDTTEHRDGTPSPDAPGAGPARTTAAPEPGPVSPGPRLTPSLARRAVARALRVARIDDMRSLDSLAARARSSAALPELRLRGVRSIDDSIRWSPTVADPYQTTRTGGVDWLLEARLAWRFDRLVFDGAEIQVERLRAQRREAQARLTEKVLEALIAWQKARLGQHDPLLQDDERTLLVLQELEASARLDVLTGGWFSTAVAAPGTSSEAGRAERQ